MSVEKKILQLDINEDKWFFFELVGIKKDGIKCTSDFKLWWIGANDVGLKELAFYNHALELENFASSHKTQVKVYVEGSHQIEKFLQV